MEKGARLKEAGDSAGALAAYQEAVQSDPTNALAHNELGTLLYSGGRSAEAIVEFRKATECDPSYALAYYNYAFSSRKAGRFQEAVNAYQHYQQLKPDDPDAKFGLAESLRALGRNAEAVQAYEAYIAQEARPSEQAWVEKARALVQQLRAQLGPQPTASPVAGGPAAAPAPPPTAPAPASSSVAAALARGDSALAAHRPSDAARAYLEAVNADSRNAVAHFKLGVAYAELNFLPQAVDEWQLVLKIDPGNQGAQDNIQRARARLSAASPPPRAAAAPAVAPAPVAAPPPVAQPAAPTPAARPPVVAPAAPAPDAAQAERFARADYEQAVTLISQRRYADSVVALNAALQLQPKLAVAYVARGSANVGLGRYPDAVQDYLKGLSLDANQASPLFGLGEAYRGLGDRARASRYYQECAQSTAPDAAAVRDLARKRYADLVR